MIFLFSVLRLKAVSLWCFKLWIYKRCSPWSSPGELQPPGAVLCLCDVPVNCSKAVCVQGSPRIPLIALMLLISHCAEQNINTSPGKAVFSSFSYSLSLEILDITTRVCERASLRNDFAFFNESLFKYS